MFARALLVLLSILNLGVALWWLAREPHVDGDTVVLPAGVETLQLLQEPAPPATAAAPVPPAPSAPPAEDDSAGADAAPLPPAVAVPAALAPGLDAAAAGAATTCRSFGPFADVVAAGQARSQLLPAVQQASVRERRPQPRGWRVVMPRLANAAAATAAAERLVAAGFTDHYRMPAGEDGRVDVALGRFGSEAAAQRHRDALVAAGFQVVSEPIGGAGEVRYWIDVAAAGELDVVALRRAIGAAEVERIECRTGAPAA